MCVYIRKYRIPENEQSHNQGNGKTLPGVSVYLAKESDENRYLIDAEFGTRDPNAGKLRNFLEDIRSTRMDVREVSQNVEPIEDRDLSKHIYYLVTGTRLNEVGPDGEALLTDVVVLHVLVWDIHAGVFTVATEAMIQYLAVLYPLDFCRTGKRKV